MNKLSPSDLLPLETYARERAAFRERVITHKRPRKVHVGAHITLLFEDRLTIQYQVQEILRTEKIFEPEGIAEELEAYNPLIPDGRNLKATMLIEYEDAEVRKRELVKLRGVEHEVSLDVAGHAPVRAIADEDLPRSNEDKTSAVHFLRFELGEKMIADFRRGAGVSIRIEHPACRGEQALGEEQRRALAADFD
ncbi:MAG TPA: DUF3501 family protein [Rhodanobacteraceae bacterium]|nr:DUF3501 family protein [Rhodanobacteraceae bacterium]